MKRHGKSAKRRRDPTHDSGYKLLFAHAAMVRDLLRGFVPGAWVRALDLTTLERCSGSYVSDDLRDRADDIIWRLRWGEDWLYLYLLLEFQSSIDVWMAVRIQTYIGLLYQDLIRAEQLSAAGRLPPVLPIVLYNGAQLWSAAETLDSLIEPVPAMLADYRPRQRYLLLDEQRLAKVERLPMRNLSAALFRLEASRGADEAMAIVRALIDWLKDPEQSSLRRAFAVWLGRVFLPKRLPGVSFTPMDDLSEVYHMLADNVETWADTWKQQGREQGREQGLEQGREQGLEQGLEQGREATRHLLLRQVRRRFGSEIAERSEPLLARISDLEQLEELGDQLLLSADGKVWLSELERPLNDR
jgi:predicted transposase YdaD